MSDKKMIENITGRCMAVRTLSAARAITRRYDSALRPLGITITQFTLLAAVARIEPDSITELADKLWMERTSLTRGAKLLEADGLIERRVEEGVRKRGLRISDKGIKLLREAYPLWQNAQQDVEEQLGKQVSEANHFLDLLRSAPF
ncbi:MAG: MarR family transcriptional regulator [Cellvibrionaceae bacterium]|uniref:MarR family winged helix-turn-helix transcriptional regulator n=1 Tax=uncultured Pseudoteredinibacter sp. TaxID=1641701 RepID=UPI002638E8AD|nr:MarR family transcriptional regulator [uncultured Pseudoteredinibacter sp.]MCV6622204.1 MarR family transcriptional regulator [Cellvibrionaceae bacterium]